MHTEGAINGTIRPEPDAVVGEPPLYCKSEEDPPGYKSQALSSNSSRQPHVTFFRPVGGSDVPDRSWTSVLSLIFIQLISTLASSIFLSGVLAHACLSEVGWYRKVGGFLAVQLYAWSGGRWGVERGPPPPAKEPKEGNDLPGPSDPGPFQPSGMTEEEWKRKHGDELLTTDPAYYARLAGFDLETRSFWTEGGWEIVMHRVISPKHPKRTGAKMARGYPVLFMHGLFQCSGAFLCNEERSLPFLLANQGYDVWLGNQRGLFGAGHKTYSRFDRRYWAWNVRDLGHDLGCMVEGILAETGYEKLAYIGHSQGSASGFVALSKTEIPELGQRISCFVALAPAVFAGPLTDEFPLNMTLQMSRTAWNYLFGVLDYLPEMSAFTALAAPSLVCYFGYRMLNFLFGWSDRTWLKSRKPKYFRFTPTSSSSENIYWWTGPEGFAKNACIFDPEVKPWFTSDFPPLALFWGSRDYLCLGSKLVERIETIESPLAGVQLLQAKEIEGFEHMVYWSDASLEVIFRDAEACIRKSLPGEMTPRGPAKYDQIS